MIFIKSAQSRKYFNKALDVKQKHKLFYYDDAAV